MNQPARDQRPEPKSRLPGTQAGPGVTDSGKWGMGAASERQLSTRRRGNHPRVLIYGPEKV